jgi:dephospho-CoA kinase
MIVGLTGTLASGKGVVSEYFKEKGYVYLSLSDELRALARERGIEITRENLQNLGDEMRAKEGVGFLAKLVVKRIKENNYENAIVDGIRNPGEIIELKKLSSFIEQREQKNRIDYYLTYYISPQQIFITHTRIC